MSELHVKSLGETVTEVADSDDHTVENGTPLDTSVTPAPSRPSGLSCIRKGKQPGPRRIILYGTNGIGKSTFASHAPNPVFLLTEDGVRDLDVTSFPVAKSYEEFMHRVLVLQTETHDFSTVVVDTVDWLERLIFRSVAKKHRKETVGDIGYGKGPGYAAEVFVDMLDTFQRFLSMDIGVIMLGHKRDEKICEADNEPYWKSCLDLHPLMSAVAREWCDELFYAKFPVVTIADDKERKNVRATGTIGKRVMVTVETPTNQGKCRLQGLPTELELSWDAFDKFRRAG